MHLNNKARLVNYVLHAKHAKAETRVDRLDVIIAKSQDSHTDDDEPDLCPRGTYEFKEIAKQAEKLFFS